MKSMTPSPVSEKQWSPLAATGRVRYAAAAAAVLGAASGQALAQSQAGGDQKSSAIQAGPVTLTFGGFTELAVIYRNRNEVADVGSDFANIPYASNAASTQSEFRESARQSRFSLLAQGRPYDHARAESYLEADFLSAGVTSNSRESNSYTLRMRNFYGRFVTDSGLDLLAGQSWSLTTLEKKGMAPRDENIPLTIDAQYVVGFNWSRNPQVRLVQHFGPAVSFGVSIESPQAVTSGGINCAGLPAGSACPPASSGIIVTNNGDAGGLLNNSTSYSADTRPDVVAKVALDPGYGHFEVYGLGRWFTSNVVRQSQTTSGGGIGAGVILPLVPNLLNIQASGLVGNGIGRYGSTQLPDVTMQPNGQLSPLHEEEFLAGVTFTPGTALSAYAYAGRERASATYYTVGAETFGYGAPVFSGNTNSVDEETAGFWWKFYHGDLGNFQFGLQAAYFERKAFAIAGGAPGPFGNMFVGMASFRYYPYQR